MTTSSDIKFPRGRRGKLVYCPTKTCLTQYARETAHLGKEEVCGNCLKKVVLVIGIAPLKKPVK